MNSNLNVSRRSAIKLSLWASSWIAMPATLRAAPAPSGPSIARWIDGGAPEWDAGQTFGMAWPMGKLSKREALTALGDDGRAHPVQSWTAAYWPDGSIKWTGHALPAGVKSESVAIQKGKPAAASDVVSVQQSGDAILVTNGNMQWKLPRSGEHLVDAVVASGRTVVGPIALNAGLSNNANGGEHRGLHPKITEVAVEQTGPIRAVVRFAGVMSEGPPNFPFTVRLYFTAGTDAVRMVFSFIHDGQPERDFLAALGVEAQVPLTAEPHDRHVRFALSDKLLFTEAARPLTGLRRDPGKAFREAQAAGKPTPPLSEMEPAVAERLDVIPIWNDFRLHQHSANGAQLVKRTADGQSWIDADEARRTPGLASVSTPTGGLAIGVQDFWQRHPSALEVSGLGGDIAKLTAWLWSPDAAPMDMRSYRAVNGMEGFDKQNDGLAITYEDYEPGWDDARGIARTSELLLWPTTATKSHDEYLAAASFIAKPPRLIAQPESLYRANVFGPWSLPSRANPAHARLEAQQANLVDFYRNEVDQRSWYGFWDYGDVMHTYDADRHQWRYDIGGYAWDNSELSTDLWLWYQAIRTGDAATFRLAEAMTRHTGEVDVYHLGRFKGLGTRHGVQHFSDSSKQPRISTSVYRRIYYYLTCDERTGDLMRDLLDSGERLRDVEIGRKVPGVKKMPLPPGSIEMNFGTVWCSLAANWLAEWERTGNRKWRDRLISGMESIGAMPNGWMTGAAPYDLNTGRFHSINTVDISHLNAVFGAMEVNAELLQLLDVPSYKRAWLDYCVFYNAPRAQFEAKFGPWKGPFNLREGHSRLTAYAAWALNDPALAQRAAEEFYSGVAGLGTVNGDPRQTLANGVVEWPGVSTNAAAQWGLAAIQNLRLIPDHL